MSYYHIKKKFIFNSIKYHLKNNIIKKIINNIYLCRTNIGFPRHLKTALFPSGIASSFISIFANASTSAEALNVATKSYMADFAI